MSNDIVTYLSVVHNINVFRSFLHFWTQIFSYCSKGMYLLTQYFELLRSKLATYKDIDHSESVLYQEESPRGLTDDQFERRDLSTVPVML
jgi:hypothetical protein